MRCDSASPARLKTATTGRMAWGALPEHKRPLAGFLGVVRSCDEVEVRPSAAHRCALPGSWGRQLPSRRSGFQDMRLDPTAYVEAWAHRDYGPTLGRLRQAPPPRLQLVPWRSM